MIPNSVVEMGSAGDPPVSSGHWPDEREGEVDLTMTAQSQRMSFPVPRGESPCGTGGSPVLPVGWGTAVPKFGFKGV